MGSIVGMLACLLFALIGGGSPLVMALSAVAGYCVGAVVGLVLWSGSADLPEDPVLPPHPGQRRPPGQRW